ncbi:MAG: hypothetical protein ACRDJC_09520 [Thermomicrobiales bacterium]
MQAVNRGKRTANCNDVELRRMIGPDKHRPGLARARLVAEQIPVWAIIGYIGAVVGTTDPTAITNEAIAQVAADYDISHEAVQAALLYYGEHRAVIDALLEANEAALA